MMTDNTANANTEETPVYGWCLIPPYIMARQDITLAQKVLFGRIKGFLDTKGVCHASNQWLGEQIDLSIRQVSRLLSDLQVKGLIEINVYRDENLAVRAREIFEAKLPHLSIPHVTDVVTPHVMDGVVSNRDINNREQYKTNDNVPSVVDDKSDLDDILEDIDKGDRIRTEYQFQGLYMWEQLHAPENKKGSFIKVARDEEEGLVNEAFYFAKGIPTSSIRWKMFFKRLSNLKKDKAGRVS